jgi:DNA-binding NtrC family response regulator
MSHLDEPLVFLGMPAIIESEPMRRLFEIVQRVARTEAAVLISGESGTGKELIARALHCYSPRCSRPWVDVSCAALPEHLIESEMFGHEKGAFSGAASSKPGLFELADKGTLFLDEIGELEPKMQVKLLRVLDGTPYYRLGGVRKVSVDVRVLAASNQNLEEMVRRGQFRTDLYHRLSEIEVDVPPLRERPEDILPLAEFFLLQRGDDFELCTDARHVLENYSWPGNVRELRNAVMKAVVMARDKGIRASDLPGRLRETLTATVPRLNGLSGKAETADLRLDGIERRTIFRVLERTGGHHQKAAQLLGISRRTLSRKLKLYAMESGQDYQSEGIQ